jgi:hypothetical protein
VGKNKICRLQQIVTHIVADRHVTVHAPRQVVGISSSGVAAFAACWNRPDAFRKVCPRLLALLLLRLVAVVVWLLLVLLLLLFMRAFVTPRPRHMWQVISHVGSFTNIRGAHNMPYLVRTTARRPLTVFLQVITASSASWMGGL